MCFNSRHSTLTVLRASIYREISLHWWFQVIIPLSKPLSCCKGVWDTTWSSCTFLVSSWSCWAGSCFGWVLTMEVTGSLLESRVSSLSFSCWVTSTPCYQRFEFDTKTMQRNSDRLFSKNVGAMHALRAYDAEFSLDYRVFICNMWKSSLF